MSATPVASKSARLPVTTVMPWTMAVAAISASRSARGSGTCSRAHLADSAIRDELYRHFHRLRDALEASRRDALVVVGAEHFANFFFDNMPAYCVGMADFYEGPIEDEAWLAIERRRIPGAPELSKRLITRILDDCDVAYAQEWKFDHGISVPLHFLTPRYDLPVVPVNINCRSRH